MVDEISYRQQRLATPSFFKAGFQAGGRNTTSPQARRSSRRRNSGAERQWTRHRIPEQERLGALRHIAEIRAVLAASLPAPGDEELADAVGERRAG